MGCFVIGLTGQTGAGKSTVGVVLAKVLGCRFLDSDLVIQEETGRLLHEIISGDGLAGFLEIENDVNSRIEAQNSIIATGGSVVYGEQAMRHLKEIGTVVYLEVNPETVLKRLKGDTTRPLLQGGDVTQRVKEFLAVRGPIYRETAGMVVDVNDRTVDEIVAELEERMGFE